MLSSSLPFPQCLMGPTEISHVQWCLYEGKGAEQLAHGRTKTVLCPYLCLNLVVKELLLELGQGVVCAVVVKVKGIEHIPAERS